MIKHIISIQIVTILLTSCISYSQNLKGEYYKQGKDFRYELTLNDSSFILTQKYFEVNSTCNGKWNYVSKDTIFLRCEEVDKSAKFESGYMNERERKIILISKKKMKLGNVILKKK